MYWHGIEWAVPFYELVMVILPVFAFVAFHRRVKRGVLAKSGALWRSSSLVVVPVVGFVLFFFCLVGIEELTSLSLLSEGLGRSFLPLVGLGAAIWLVSTLVFAASLLFVSNVSREDVQRTSANR